MTLIFLGLMLFALVHLVPSAMPGVKAAWLGKMGEGGYKGIFSLLLLASFVLMVMGWRSVTPEGVYSPLLGREQAFPLMVLAFILMAASGLPTRIKRVIRHPQLTGLALWAITHLLANGDNRSLLLFGGMLLWSVVEIVLINRRDGAWQKPEAPALVAELKVVVIGLIVTVVFVFAHPYIAGVALR
jgi:uncharacterized membrane protein